MLFEFSVLLRCPSPLEFTKRHSKLRRSTATTSMRRWSFPLHWKLDARLSTPKIFKMARQLMDNSPFEIPSLDHPASRQCKSFSILPCAGAASRTKLVYLFGRIISALALAQQEWKYVQNYADAKTVVIEETITRLLTSTLSSTWVTT